MDATPKYWFPAKRYGWGWGPPVTWQGWLASAIWLALLIAASIFFGSHTPLFVASVIILIAAIIALCWWKGEPPRWRWGD